MLLSAGEVLNAAIATAAFVALLRFNPAKQVLEEGEEGALDDVPVMLRGIVALVSALSSDPRFVILVPLQIGVGLTDAGDILEQIIFASLVIIPLVCSANDRLFGMADSCSLDGKSEPTKERASTKPSLQQPLVSKQGDRDSDSDSDHFFEEDESENGEDDDDSEEDIKQSTKSRSPERIQASSRSTPSRRYSPGQRAAEMQQSLPVGGLSSVEDAKERARRSQEEALQARLRALSKKK